uniref:Uncharacterized protein n=1 Tax=Cyprinus carpio TaxID=7962 RepID=A0A8C1ZJV2_CYPCA
MKHMDTEGERECRGQGVHIQGITHSFNPFMQRKVVGIVSNSIGMVEKRANGGSGV